MPRFTIRPNDPVPVELLDALCAAPHMPELMQKVMAVAAFHAAVPLPGEPGYTPLDPPGQPTPRTDDAAMVAAHGHGLPGATERAPRQQGTAVVAQAINPQEGQ